MELLQSSPLDVTHNNTKKFLRQTMFNPNHYVWVDYELKKTYTIVRIDG
jgi:hypothetical protein